MDDLIRAFMQTTNYRTYLKGGRSGKGPDKAELRLWATQRSGDAEVIAKVLSSFPGAEDLITKPRGLDLLKGSWISHQDLTVTLIGRTR